MDNATVKLIEQLAEKFGTSAEYLWGALLRQAPISAAVDLVFSLLLISFTVLAVMLCIKKTLRSDDECPEWEDEKAFLAWLVAALSALFTLMITSSSMGNIFAGFFNPEYWALKQLLG